MTTTELLNTAQYIVDKDGQQQGVIIDVATWRAITAALKKLETLETTGPIKDISELPELNKQFLALLRTPPSDNEDDIWWDEFEQELRDNRIAFRREANFD